MEEYPKNDDKQAWPKQVRCLINDAECGRSEAADALLNWLKDMNWPGAREAHAFLVANLVSVVPKIKEVLCGDDLVWQYWVLHCLVAEMPHDMARELTPRLVAMTERDDREEVNLAAALVLCEKRLCPEEQLVRIVDRVGRFNPDCQAEIQRLRVYLA